MDFDLLIQRGRILDGKGGESFLADIGLRGDRIEAIGELANASAEQTISAEGCYVCPGFIDAHSHSDAYLLLEPTAQSKLFQGITTEIVGNCGSSAAPRMGAYKMPSDWANKSYPGEWQSVAEYRQLLERVHPAVNTRILIGLNALHIGVCGHDPRGATPSELKSMVYRLEEALDQGGSGLSSGLIYPPSSALPRSEIHTLAQVLSRKDAIYTSHMRSEGEQLLEAISETIELGSQNDCRVEISHLKVSGRGNWHLIDRALEKIESARADGIDLAADRYPYTAACTELDILLPEWASYGGRERVMKRLQDKLTRAKIKAEIKRAKESSYWDSVMVGSTEHPANRDFRGMRISEIARQNEIEPVETMLRLIESDRLTTGGIFFGMSETNMWRILKEPYVMLGTDASLRAPSGILSHDHPHPRAYGSFTRFLRAALDGKTVPLGEAIRKMSALPASQFRINDRGVLAAGKMADIIVFDPNSVLERTTYADPHQLSSGIRSLIVNGIETIAGGKLLDRRAGRFLD